jgi:hypothetical protein
VRRRHGSHGGSSGGGESFMRVHWVAVPKALRARRVNRRRTGAGAQQQQQQQQEEEEEEEEEEEGQSWSCSSSFVYVVEGQHNPLASAAAEGELFPRFPGVHWVAVPQALRARRVNRRRWSAGPGSAGPRGSVRHTHACTHACCRPLRPYIAAIVNHSLRGRASLCCLQQPVAAQTWIYSYTVLVRSRREGKREGRGGEDCGSPSRLTAAAAAASPVYFLAVNVLLFMHGMPWCRCSLHRPKLGKKIVALFRREGLPLHWDKQGQAAPTMVS